MLHTCDCCPTLLTGVAHLKLVLHPCNCFRTLGTGVTHLRLVLHTSDWCCKLASGNATSRLVSHTWDWCHNIQEETFNWSPNKSSKLGVPVKSSPFSSLQVNFDTFIMHPPSSTQQHFLQLKTISQIFGQLSNLSPVTPDNIPTKSVGYNFVPQCLPNHTQPVGRFQKKLKGDRSADHHRKRIKNHM